MLIRKSRTNKNDPINISFPSNTGPMAYQYHFTPVQKGEAKKGQRTPEESIY